MDVSPSVAAPTAQSVAKKKRYLIGLVVLLLIAGGAYWFSTTTLVRMHGVRYVAGSFEDRGLYEVGWFGSKPVSFPVVGRVIDYVREGKTEAAVILAEDGTQDIYRVTGKEIKQITIDGKTKSGLSLSSDGSLAYSERTEAASSTADVTTFYNPAAWEVMVLKNGSPENVPVFMGNGFGPEFFTFNGVPHLLYTADASLHFVNLATDAHQDIAISRGQLAGLMHAAVSPDGAYVALPDVAFGSALYALTEQENHFAITPIGPLPLSTVGVAFSGDRLMSISSDEVGTAIRQSTVDAPSAIRYGYRLPDQIVIKLIP